MAISLQRAILRRKKLAGLHIARLSRCVELFQVKKKEVWIFRNNKEVGGELGDLIV